MLLFLLPLIFNPFSFIVRWVPALYLAAWPIIIQTLGQDALVLHALLLTIFILTCDTTRNFMLRYIGIDFISMPAGVLLVSVLLSDRGATLMSHVVSIFGTLLGVVEPVIILLETYVVMDIINAFNRWVSRMSNIRDENSDDLSTWDPPLTRGSMFMRFIIILITLVSYLGTYMIVSEAKQLLGADDQAFPVHFNHAISLLVTLQLISLTSTIYKEAGVLSETAMVALTASVPIFIASWSYYHIKTSTTSSSGLSSGPGGGPLGVGAQEPRIVFDEHLDGYQSSGAFGFGNNYGDHHHHQLDYGAVERSIHLMSPSDSIFKKAILAFFRQLIMLINSVLGLSWDKMAQYYFGPDFWYILGARLVFLVWWVVSVSKNDRAETGRLVVRDPSARLRSLPDRVRRLSARLPINRTTLIKCLFVLVYAQMIIKEMENRHSMAEQTDLLMANGDKASGVGCCGSRALQDDEKAATLLDGSTSWLRCMWNSAQACTGSQTSAQAHLSRASRLLEALLGLVGQALDLLLAMLGHAYGRLANLHTSIHYIYTLWLLRWRSSIIQRLMQSVLIQIYYICSLLFADDDDDNENRDDFL